LKQVLGLAAQHEGHPDSGHHDRTPLKRPLERVEVVDVHLIPVTTTGPH